MLNRPIIISFFALAAFTATIGTANAGLLAISHIETQTSDSRFILAGSKFCFTTSCTVREKIKAQKKKDAEKYCDRNIRDHRKARRNVNGEYIYLTPKGGRCINDHRTEKKPPYYRPDITVKDHRIKSKATDHRTTTTALDRVKKAKALDHRAKTRVIDQQAKTKALQKRAQTNITNPGKSVSVQNRRGKATAKVQRRTTTVVPARHGRLP